MTAAIVDALAIIGASLLGRIVYVVEAGSPLSEMGVAAALGLLSSALYVFLAQSSGLYRLSALTGALKYFGRTATYSMVVSLSFTAVLFLLKSGSEFSRGTYVAFASVQIAFLCLARLIGAGTMRSMLVSGSISGQPVVVIGSQGELSRLNCGYLLHQFGFADVGRFALGRNELDHEDCLGAAVELARKIRAEAFVLAESWGDGERLTAITRALRISPLPVVLLPDHPMRSLYRKRVSSRTEPLATVELQRSPMTLAERALKRLLDIVVSSAALVVLSPILAVIAVAVRCDSAGPSIFRQRRNGFNQREFLIYKFRTMTVLEDGAMIVQAAVGDKRVTRLGRLLRRTSLDELPQLVNVLKGDMSLVGPRPHALSHDDSYKLSIERYCMRHHVKPGITGWAQINGQRGETKSVGQMQARVELDVWYIRNWSIFLDLTILVRTFLEVLKHEAY